MISLVQYVDENGKIIKHHKDDKLEGFSVAAGAELILDGIPYVVSDAAMRGEVYLVTLRPGGGKHSKDPSGNLPSDGGGGDQEAKDGAVGAAAHVAGEGAEDQGQDDGEDAGGVHGCDGSCHGE